MWIFSLDSQNGNGWNNCRPNIPSDNRKLLSDLFLSRRQNIPQNIVKLILRKGKQFWISWFLKFVANQLIFYISHLGKNINLLWFQLSRNFPSGNIIELHGNANWGGDKVLLEFFSSRIIRVWQRCDRLSCSGGRLCESQDKPFSSHFPVILERLVGRRLHLKVHRIHSSSKLSWKSPPLSLSQWRSTFILSNLIKAKVGIYVYFTNVMQLKNLTKSNWNKLCKEEQALDRQLLNWNNFHGFAWLCRRWWVTASERRSPATISEIMAFTYLLYELNISYCIV